MGKLVNVVLPGGKIVSVPEEQLTPDVKGAVTPVNPADTQQRVNEATREEEFSGLGHQVSAGIGGFLDTASFGGYGKMAEALTGDSGDLSSLMQKEAQENRGSRFVGEVGALVLPVGGAGLARNAGAKVTEGVLARSGQGVATKGTDAFARLAGRATEGGIVGAGGYVAETNVTGDPVTIEGLVTGAGLGAVLDAAIGKLADGLVGSSRKASARIAKEADETAAKVRIAEDHARFESPPPSWDEFRTVHKAAQQAVERENGKLATAWKNYDKVVREDVNDIARKDVSEAINEIRSYYAPPRGTVQRIPQTLDEIGEEGMVSTVSAKDLKGKVEQFPITDQKKLANARAAIAEGQKDPITIAVTPQGRYWVDDGRHRLAAAIEANKPIEVRWVRGAKGLDDAAEKDLPLHLRGKKQPPKQKPAKVTGVEDDGTIKLDADRKVKWDDRGRRVVEAPALTKQPMGEDTANFLREIEEEKTEVLKLWGGGRDITKGRWSKYNPEIPADKEAALEKLKAIKLKLEGRFPSAAARMRPLPLKPAPLKELNKLELPKGLTDFGRLNPQRLEVLAKHAEEFPQVNEAFGRLLDDLGLQKTGKALDDVAGTHSRIREYLEYVSKAEAEAAEVAAKESGTLLPLIRGTAKRAAKYAAGREVDRALGWGARGAVGKTLVGAGVGYAYDGTEGALIGATMIGAKQGLRGRVRNVVAKHGTRAGQRVERLAPVTALLAGHSVTGQKDPERDMRKQTVNRINEVIQLAQVAPDAMFVAVEDMLGDVSDVAHKLHSQVVNSLRYLVAVAPKDPGIDITFTGSNWAPTYAQTIAFAHAMEAVFDPDTSIIRALQGDGHPAATEALWTNYPAMMQELAMEVAAQMQDLDGNSYESGGAFRDLFRQPITGLQKPEVALALQGMYLPKPEQGPGGGTSGGGQHPTGRPPAIQSRVAGSSVAGLIS